MNCVKWPDTCGICRVYVLGFMTPCFLSNCLDSIRSYRDNRLVINKGAIQHKECQNRCGQLKKNNNIYQEDLIILLQGKFLQTNRFKSVSICWLHKINQFFVCFRPYLCSFIGFNLIWKNFKFWVFFVLQKGREYDCNLITMRFKVEIYVC